MTLHAFQFVGRILADNDCKNNNVRYAAHACFILYFIYLLEISYFLEYLSHSDSARQWRLRKSVSTNIFLTHYCHMRNGTGALRVTGKMLLPHSRHTVHTIEYWYHCNSSIIKVAKTACKRGAAIYWRSLRCVPSTSTTGNAVVPVIPALISYATLGGTQQW